MEVDPDLGYPAVLIVSFAFWILDLTRALTSVVATLRSRFFLASCWLISSSLCCSFWPKSVLIFASTIESYRADVVETVVEGDFVVDVVELGDGDVVTTGVELPAVVFSINVDASVMD